MTTVDQMSVPPMEARYKMKLAGVVTKRSTSVGVYRVSWSLRRRATDCEREGCGESGWQVGCAALVLH